MGWLARRYSAEAKDGGAYAILYAVLAVVLLGMGAIVVDVAKVRADRRLDRSATDSAVVAGARFLSNQSATGAQPKKACLAAWDYLIITLHLKPSEIPAARCSAFDVVVSPASYCTGSPAEIVDDRAVRRMTIRVAWPIPKTGGSGFLTPEIAPGNVTQPFDTDVDGSDAGCDRLGVAIFENEEFALGAVLGSSGTRTQVHSVARVDPTGGPSEDVAALNVLNPVDCHTLVKTGTGKIIVGPTLNRGVVVGPGVIAVESFGADVDVNGNGTVESSERSDCGGGDAVMEVRGGAGSICASGTSILSCDGGGIIQNHALDGPAFTRAFDPGSGIISPTPIQQGTPNRWHPVTKFYGCNMSRIPCLPPATNYIAALETAYGSGFPTPYSASQAPYNNPYPGGFIARTDICNVSGVLIIPAGNWFADCAGTISISGTLIIKGGNLVASHGIDVKGGCFVMNSDVSACPTTVVGGVTVIATSGSGAEVTTLVAPTADATLFLRRGSINNDGVLAMPQTFVYAMGANGDALSGNATVAPLWTAPGAGAVDAFGRTTLQQACWDSAAGAVDEDCMNSRFARVAYWSDYAAPRTKPNTFNGQGNLAYVGVFFTPLAYDNFTGGTEGSAAAAQFWADKLNVNGAGTISLSPDVRFAFTRPTARITLIR